MRFSMKGKRGTARRSWRYNAGEPLCEVPAAMTGCEEDGGSV